MNKPPCHGHPWTPGENKKLARHFDEGLSLYRISVRHGRTQGAVLGQLVRIGKLVKTEDGRYYRADALWHDFREGRDGE